MLPAWLGEHDDSEDFQPAHDVVAQAWRRMQVVRLSRTGLVMEALVPAVLEQKVTGIEAYRGWVALLNRYGDAAPGPAPGILRVVPEPRAWAAIPSWGWHQAGVTPERARTIVRASRVADSLERLAALPSDEADRRLQSLPGIGVWTSAEIRQRSHGDPDAISVGDANLPHHVAFALASERRATDERMLELLEPYAGHRHRAATLIAMYTPRPPRRAPRAPLRDYRRM
jgi:3-methyladenine DNA glycosylase/8-oxoguanine DNA glycosylase